MSFIIRKINSKDLNTVSTLISNAFSINPNLGIQEEFLNHPQIHCYVACDNEEIIGTASLHVIQKTNRKMGLIEDLVVTPKAQGKGVGKALLDQLIETSIALKCYKIILNSNEKSVPFYEKYGFNAKEIQMVIKH